jgi:hypothetical protein
MCANFIAFYGEREREREMRERKSVGWNHMLQWLRLKLQVLSLSFGF